MHTHVSFPAEVGFFWGIWFLETSFYSVVQAGLQLIL